jgi:hypothetical protein
VLIYSERRALLAGGWFVVREKYCWLVADKPSEQGALGRPAHVQAEWGETVRTETSGQAEGLFI